MLKICLVLLGLPLLARAQADAPGERFRLQHTVFAGVQLPLSYTAGYQAQFSRRFSARVQGGLILPPFDRYTLKTLEGFGLDKQLGDAIDRSFRRGTSLSVGVNVHANSPWYAGVFGQYVHLTSGDITPADGLGLYFKRDFSSFGLLASPALVFEMQSNLWLGGLRVGKIFTTRNTFASNRSLVDALGITQQLYTDLDHEIDTSLRQHGYLPTLDVLLTYRLAGRP
jgi:hypothetical protein